MQKFQPVQNNQECSLLLEGVVLLDTLNLSPTIQKTTDQDRSIIQYLDSQHPNYPISQKELFEQLANAKYDPTFWSSISLRDALEYDYKEFKMGTYHIGWSAILTSLSSFVGLKSFEECVSSFCKERQVDGLIFSAVLSGASIRREFHFFVLNKNSDLQEQVKHMEDLLELNYQCKREQDILFTYTPISRKALVPVLMKLFELLVCQIIDSLLFSI